MHIIGDRLKETKKELGITRPELASLIGVSEATALNWENGGREPRSMENILCKSR